MCSGVATLAARQRNGYADAPVTVLHISPHADDETLGCGGTLLRHVEHGDEVHWLVVTDLAAESGYTPEAARQRENEILAVAGAYRLARVHRLHLPDSLLDRCPLRDLVNGIGAVVREVEPAIMYTPYAADVHSDHRIVFQATIPCTKWFRHGSVRRVLAYETLSETNFGLDPTLAAFRPNVYQDIDRYLDRKLAILRLYAATELGSHPFPRSEEAVRALALLRGSEAGRHAAEAFMLLGEIG